MLYWMIVVVCTTSCVIGEAILHLSLQRFGNDNCGGFVYDQVDQPNSCSYTVNLHITTLRQRLDKKITVSNYYGLGVIEADAKYVKFPENYLSRDILNPLPIQLTEGLANVTFVAYNNLEVEVVTANFSIDTGEMEDGEEGSLVMDGWPGDNFISMSYTLSCVAGFAGAGCKTCIEGFYGPACDVECVETDSFTCHPTTGDKICLEGYYGQHCTVLCKETVDYRCSKQGRKICIHPAIGEMCDRISMCPKDHYSSSSSPSCDRVCVPQPNQYLCGSHGQRICEGNFTGINCTECIEGQYGEACDRTCTAVPGRYNCSHTGERVCAERWAGDTTCTSCSKNWNGINCEVPFCESSSISYTCDEFKYRVCRRYWKPPFCEECEENHYGQNCEVHCISSEGRWNCDPVTGKRICLFHWSGPQCRECEEGYKKRNDSCIACADSYRFTCSDTGKKLCRPNWYGKQCDKYCEDDPMRYQCIKTSTGFRRQCKGNFSGMQCTKCSFYFYGNSCSTFCIPSFTKHCLQDGSSRCAKNYFGDDCDIFCNNDSHTHTCSEKGEVVCRGNRDAGQLCSSCLPGYFGSDCEVKCLPTTKTRCDADGNIVCRDKKRKKPNCNTCAEGYYGYQCNIRCESAGNLTCNSEGALEVPSMEPQSQSIYIPLAIGVCFGFGGFASIIIAIWMVRLVLKP